MNGHSAGEAEISALYHRLLDNWNLRHAADMAGLFTEDGNLVGFDGSVVDGREEIEAQMAAIFAHHQTGAYVGKVREVRFLTPDVALLRAVSSTIPAGASDINPATNTIQTLVAVRQGGDWHIAMYHNTPAAFHGRPELSEALTAELRELL